MSSSLNGPQINTEAPSSDDPGVGRVPGRSRGAHVFLVATPIPIDILRLEVTHHIADVFWNAI